MDGSTTPSRAGLTIFDPTTPQTAAAETQLATPISLVWESPKPKTPVQETQIPPVLAQTDVDANPTVKRLQQDLLILTGFNDNATLHWRPTWFTQGSFPGSLWTIHNPPDVVTERLPNNDNGAQMFTRRMRRSNDPPPLYIKSWGHWKRYCDLYGVSYDFLCERHIRLIRMGLPRSSDGSLRSEFEMLRIMTKTDIPQRLPDIHFIQSLHLRGIMCLTHPSTAHSCPGDSKTLSQLLHRSI